MWAQAGMKMGPSSDSKMDHWQLLDQVAIATAEAGDGRLVGPVPALQDVVTLRLIGQHSLVLDYEDFTLFLQIGGSELYAAFQDDFVGNPKTGCLERHSSPASVDKSGTAMGVTSNLDNHCGKMLAALRLRLWWEAGQLDMLMIVNFDSLVGGECLKSRPMLHRRYWSWCLIRSAPGAVWPLQGGNRNKTPPGVRYSPIAKVCLGEGQMLFLLMVWRGF